MQTGSVIKDFGVVNKNDAGTWTIKATLDGHAGALTNVNVNGGTLSTDKADFLGGSGSTVKLLNGTTLQFNGTTAGAFNGTIADGLNQTTGAVLVTGPNTTTLGGINAYQGTTTIDGGKLATGSNGALSLNSDFTVKNGGTLTINNNNAVKTLSDGGSGPNTVNLNGNATQLTLTGGTWGANGGTVTGTGTLNKAGLRHAHPGRRQCGQSHRAGQLHDQQRRRQRERGRRDRHHHRSGGQLDRDANRRRPQCQPGRHDRLAQRHRRQCFGGHCLGQETLTTAGLNGTDSFAGKISGTGRQVHQGRHRHDDADRLQHLFGRHHRHRGGTLVGYAGTTGATLRSRAISALMRTRR